MRALDRGNMPMAMAIPEYAQSIASDPSLRKDDVEFKLDEIMEKLCQGIQILCSRFVDWLID